MRSASAQKYFYLYEIKNLINGKIYIGIHATYNLNDGYMGSGRRIRAAIAKYGISNFKKTILKFCSSLTEVLVAEKEIVTDDFCRRPDTYNIAVGGKCGGNLVAGKTPEELAIWHAHISDSRRIQAQSEESRENYRRIRNSPEFLRKYAETRAKTEKAMTAAQREERRALFRRAHNSPEVKQRHSDASRRAWASRSPEEKECRRPVWYNDGVSNFLFRAKDIIPPGLIRGRLMKRNPQYVYIIDGHPFYSEKDVHAYLRSELPYSTWRLHNKEWLYTIRQKLTKEASDG